MRPNPTINRTAAGWRWEVDADDSVYSGVRATREEAEAEGRRVAWVVWSTVPKIDPAAGLRADLAIAIARAEAAERDADAWRMVRDLVHKLDAEVRPGGKMDDDDVLDIVLRALRDAARPAHRAEAALASTRAEADRLRAVIKTAVDTLPEWSKGALAHLSPAEVVADDVRMALREALASLVEGA